MRHPRLAIAGLTVSAAAFVGLMNTEGWTDKAVIPVKGDVPTVGPGLTVHTNGQPVRMGDTIKPLEGVNRSLAHIQKSEGAMKRCVTAPVSQVEYDLMVDFAYQYGPTGLCRSSVVRNINAGDYVSACAAYLDYRYVGDYDCSTPGNRRCRGVWLRSQARHKQCMEAQ